VLVRLSQEAPEPSSGLVFVQSDDTSRIAQAVRSFIPRLGTSTRTDVRPPANGWIAVDDELCSGDPELLRRLAQELSYRTGRRRSASSTGPSFATLFDRGSAADEYASVPSITAAAARRRGRPERQPDGCAPSTMPIPTRPRGRSHRRLPADLPPAQELCAEIAAVLGVPLA
jgi:hypothetical protein